MELLQAIVSNGQSIEKTLEGGVKETSVAQVVEAFWVLFAFLEEVDCGDVVCLSVAADVVEGFEVFMSRLRVHVDLLIIHNYNIFQF